MRRIRSAAAAVAAVTTATAMLALAPSAPAATTRSIHGSVTGGLFSCTFTLVSRDRLIGTCTVSDTASDGLAVYVQHKYISDHSPDSAWMRLTGNAGGYNHSHTYTIDRTPLPNPTRPFIGNVDHWGFRVCTTQYTDQNFLPHDDDNCGYQHVLDSE